MKKLVVCLLAVTMVLCMSIAVVSVSADDTDFAPSVEVKPVPEFVASGEAGNTGVTINDAEVNKTPVAADAIITTYYNEAKATLENAEATDAEKAISQTLVNAYEALKSAGVEASIEGIDEFVSEELEIANPEYFVTNVFELSVGTLEEGETVTVCFDNATIGAVAGKFVVAHMVGEDWVIVDAENVKVTEAVVEVTFDSLCPVVFLSVDEGDADTTTGTTAPTTTETEKAPTTTETETEKAPATTGEDDGVMTATIIILSITAVIIIGIVVFYFLEKKGVLGNMSQGGSKKK